jgi:dienelactone hydrolase
MALPAAWLKALGIWPERVGPQLTTLETEDCGSYVREKVSYAVEAGDRISAYLCRPKQASAPSAAIFCHHQHGGKWMLGKDEPVGLAGSADLAYAKELAESGFVTLTPDLPCFGERANPDDAPTAHYFALASRLIDGRTLLAKVLHEVSIGIDLLQSLPYVDKDRIGFIGHSYGGRTAIVSAAHDERIKAAVSNCGCTSYADMVRHRTGIQLDYVVPGINKIGDLPDLLPLIEPRAILVIGGSDDKWSIGLDAMCRAAQSRFKNGELAWRVFEGGHAFPREMRTLSYEFLSKHLLGK